MIFVLQIDYFHSQTDNTQPMQKLLGGKLQTHLIIQRQSRTKNVLPSLSLGLTCCLFPQISYIAQVSSLPILMQFPKL